MSSVFVEDEDTPHLFLTYEYPAFLEIGQGVAVILRILLSVFPLLDEFQPSCRFEIFRYRKIII